jgi:hypothetical protein
MASLVPASASADRTTTPPPPLLRRLNTQAALEGFLSRLVGPEGGGGGSSSGSSSGGVAGGGATGTGRAPDEFLGPLDEDVLLFSTLLLETILEHSSFAGPNDPSASPRACVGLPMRCHLTTSMGPARVAATVQELLLRSRAYYRAHTEEALQALVDAVHKVASPRDQLEVARVFNEFLNLANLAEKHHRIRRYASHPCGPPLC